MIRPSEGPQSNIMGPMKKTFPSLNMGGPVLLVSVKHLQLGQSSRADDIRTECDANVIMLYKCEDEVSIRVQMYVSE